MDYSEEQIEKACEMAGATSKEFAFPVELSEAFWLCAHGGMTLSKLVWKLKECAVEAAKGQHGTKAEAATALDISPQTLWNIEQGRHK